MISMGKTSSSFGCSLFILMQHKILFTLSCFPFCFVKEETSRFHDFNGEDFIKFWLQSIYTYAAQDSADDKGYPPIFIIGTHKRDSPVEEDAVKRKIFGILKEKKYEKYVRRQFHFLENDPTKKQPSDEEAFKATKVAVAKAAINAPHMKEKYPIKWLQFHKAVIERCDNTPYMTLDKTRKLAAECDITDESQFTTMLGLYHDLGTIIWFGEDKILRNTVILDPQWLIDVFKAVITVLPDEKQDPKFVKMWQELRDHGILCNKLIDHVWVKWIGIKQELLELMERFDMLFRQPAKDTNGQTEEKGQQEYCVPACLHPTEGNVDITDGIFYVDFDTFLPDGFFHRVLVHFARWSSQHTDKAPELFYRFCKSIVGPENKRHVCSLQMIQSSEKNSACIKITLKKVAEHGKKSGSSTGEPDPEVCTTVFDFMSKTLHELRDKWAKGIKYTMTVGCVACREEGKQKLHLIPMEECGSGSYLCRNTDTEIPAKQLYWKADTGVSSSTEKPKPKQGRHVMISYSWGQRKECQKRMITLRDQLQTAGFQVWLDVDEMRGNMDDRMAEAVDGAFVILLCFSKDYQKSGSCKKEAQYAKYKGKPIIPLKFDKHSPDGWLGLLICSLLYYDVQTENSMSANLPGIIKDIQSYPEGAQSGLDSVDAGKTVASTTDTLASGNDSGTKSGSVGGQDKTAAPTLTTGSKTTDTLASGNDSGLGAKSGSDDKAVASTTAKSMTWQYLHTVDTAGYGVWACHMISHNQLAVCLRGRVQVYTVSANNSTLAYTVSSKKWKGKIIIGVASE
ncbi:uncharacterized protein [Amphiura filiformis]|uniref:uncharacterized protein n=1 Tax=Amphiura filiformis TaxID=82378 RepID=UPI003B228BC8